MDCASPAASAAHDILSMKATLTSYDHLFGPDHAQTLTVMCLLGRALWRAGDTEPGRNLLERAALGLSRCLPREHSLRLLALRTLGELLFEQGDLSRACLIQREVLDCQRLIGEPEHHDTTAVERSLAATLLELGRCTHAT